MLKRPHVLSAGRLDVDSEGLLLLTNSGALSRYLTLPANGIIRQYDARLYFGGRASPELVARELARGLRLGDEMLRPIELAPCQGSEKSSQAANQWYSLRLAEGKNREVRRALEHFGVFVTRLVSSV
jgi:23S rRNA pseudouridine2605 synthase